MESITIAGDDIYEYAEEDIKLRTYVIQVISTNGYVSSKRIHTVNFEKAYKYAIEYLEDMKLDRIISIKEVYSGK